MDKVYKFQISLLTLSVALCWGERLDKAPYLPSGWRPKGPAFELPTETKKPAPILESIPEFQSEGSTFLREYGPPKVIVGSIQNSINPVQDSIYLVKDLVNPVQDSINNFEASVNQVQDSINQEQDLANQIQGSVNQLKGSVTQVQDSESPEGEPEIIPEDILQDLTVQALPDVEVNLNFRNDLIQEEYKTENESETGQIETVNKEKEISKNGEEKVNFDVILVGGNTEKAIISKTGEVVLETEKDDERRNTDEKSDAESKVPVGFKEYGPPKSSPKITQDPKTYQAPLYLPQQPKRVTRRVRISAPKIRNRH